MYTDRYFSYRELPQASVNLTVKCEMQVCPWQSPVLGGKMAAQKYFPFILRICFSFIKIPGFCLHLCQHIVCMSATHRGQKRESSDPGTRVRDVHELPGGCWKSNLPF